MGHIQCACPSLERARIAAHHHIWRGLLAMLAASSQPILVPSGTRWTKKTGRPTGDVIDDADFLARVKQGQGTVTLTEAEMAGDFSRRHLAKGVHIRDDSDHWVPANDTEVEWSTRPVWGGAAAGTSLAPQMGASMPHIRMTQRTPPLFHSPPAVTGMTTTRRAGLVESRTVRLHLQLLTSRVATASPNSSSNGRTG